MSAESVNVQLLKEKASKQNVTQLITVGKKYFEAFVRKANSQCASFTHVQLKLLL